jgi:hypothetical protein
MEQSRLWWNTVCHLGGGSKGQKERKKKIQLSGFLSHRGAIKYLESLVVCEKR